MFTPKTPVRELWDEHVSSHPSDYDWSRGWIEDWDYHEAIHAGCECGHTFWTTADADECPKCGETCGTYAQGPMMNYSYPISLARVGDDPVQAAMLIKELPLCVIEWSEGGYSLALTGGGLDLSWEICEAYMRLGFLPPAHFAMRMPRFAGMRLNSVNKWILAGCRRSLLLQKEWARQGLRHLRGVREWMRGQ